MKMSCGSWCKVQEALANLKCPSCFSTEVKCTEDETKNATCEKCGCEFKFNPDIAVHME